MLGIDPKTARSAWTYASIFAAVMLLLCIVWVIRKTLLVFATALMFAYLLYPLVDAVDRRARWKTRTPAVALPFLLIFLILTGCIWKVKGPLAAEYKHLKENEPALMQQAKDWTVLDFPVGEHLVDAVSGSKVEAMVPQLSGAVKTIGRYLLNLVIIPILAFFILKDGRAIRDSMVEMFSNKQQAEGFLTDAHDLLLEYMRALLLLCLAALVTFTSVLSIMQVNYPILLGLVAFTLEFVPLMGPLVSALIIIGVSYFTHYPHLWWVIVFLFVYRLFQDYVLSPHLMKRSVKLHPLLVLFGVFAGGEIGNAPGIFLSIPVLALARLVYFETTKHRGLSPGRILSVITHSGDTLV